MVTFRRDDILTIVKEKTGYYKYDLKTVMDAVEDAIITLLGTVTYEDSVEVRAFDGIVFQARKEPERPAIDPRTRMSITAREKVKVNVKVGRGFKGHVEVEAGVLAPEKWRS